jgi:hypothetical protein
MASLAYLVAVGNGSIVSPWLPPDVVPDVPVHLAGAIAAPWPVLFRRRQLKRKAARR